jgi:hypothetical protein
VTIFILLWYVTTHLFFHPADEIRQQLPDRLTIFLLFEYALLRRTAIYECAAVDPEVVFFIVYSLFDIAF